MAAPKKARKETQRTSAREHKLNEERFLKAWAKIVAKAWNDQVFKQKLFSRPADVFREFGIVVDDHITLKILENSASVEYLVFPNKPEGIFSEEDLRKIAGGQVGQQTSQSVVEK